MFDCGDDVIVDIDPSNPDIGGFKFCNSQSIGSQNMDRVCHFEVPYSEKERMEKFYSGVFGWQFMAAPGDVPYTFAMTNEVDESYQPKKPGGINGGTYPRSEGDASDSPVIVIEVESCDQRIKDVVDAGGTKLMDAQNVGGMGIYAQVKDTENNIIGLWQPLG